VGEEEVADYVKTKIKLAPIGRLDKDSSGLLLLTNDGRVTERLLHPDFWHEKEYEVGVNRPLTTEAIRALTRGVELDDGYVTRECTVKQLDERLLLITLTEGKKRQIRRMLESLGFRVRELKRVRIMNLRLSDLEEGRWRELTLAERTAFLTSLGLTKA
jgi:pseudouridine synthase